MQSNQVLNSVAFSLLFPFVLAGDEVLDILFVISNWDQFNPSWLRPAQVCVLIVCGGLQMAVGAYHLRKSQWTDRKVAYVAWALLCWTNLIEVYLFWSVRVCCDCCCSWKRNRKLETEVEKMLPKLGFLHFFLEDCVQLALQWCQVFLNKVTYQNGTYSTEGMSDTDQMCLLLGTALFCWSIITYLMYKCF